MENNKYTPAQFFQIVKGKKNIATDELLAKIYDNSLILLNQYQALGQTQAMKKLLFHIDCLEKERELIKAGINIFVYRDDIEDYINNVADDVVRIIELENYERNIPEDVAERIIKVKDLFDMICIVFTDYTGEARRIAEKERDPIAFGIFKNESISGSILDRFYFLGDWVDEYCDLTLSKMVSEMEAKQNKNIQHPISTPEDIEKLKEQLNSLHKNGNTYLAVNSSSTKITVF